MSKKKSRSATATSSFGSYTSSSRTIPSSFDRFTWMISEINFGKYKWIIVCTDYLTRYAVTKALPIAEAPKVSKFLLEEILLRHGEPRIIILDRGQVFQSKLISELTHLCNVKIRMTTAYHPQTNGHTERFNKTLADMLSMYVDVEQKDWDKILPFVTFGYNTAKQNTKGFSPFYWLHGR